MRIGYVIWSLELGGAEQVVMRLAAGMKARGHEVAIFTLNAPGVYAPEMEAQGIPVVPMHKQGAYDIAVIGRLAKAIRQRRCDVVHTHLWGAGLWGRLAARLAGVPVILAHEHGMQPWRGTGHFLADRLLMSVTDRVLFASEQVREDYLARTGAKSGRCLVLPNGVECAPWTETRAEVRAALGWAPQERIVLSVGRLSPEKGYVDLLQAFTIVSRRLPGVRLVLVGDGEQADALRGLGAQLGLNSQIVFAGRRTDVRRWLAGADVYVQPSRREGLPLAVLEAMAAGLPVVVTRVGDLEQLTREGTLGRLVSAERPQELAEALIGVLEHVDAQRPMTEAARAMVEKFYSFGRMVQTVEDLYQEQLRYHAPPPR